MCTRVLAQRMGELNHVPTFNAKREQIRKLEHAAVVAANSSKKMQGSRISLPVLLCH
jgi:hypothetical protein